MAKKPASKAATESGPKVTIAQTGNVKEVEFKAGLTVKQALAAASISTGSGVEVRLNGAACADQDTTLSANDTILVVGRIRGA